MAVFRQAIHDGFRSRSRRPRGPGRTRGRSRRSASMSLSRRRSSDAAVTGGAGPAGRRCGSVDRSHDGRDLDQRRGPDRPRRDRGRRCRSGGDGPGRRSVGDDRAARVVASATSDRIGPRRTQVTSCRSCRCLARHRPGGDLCSGGAGVHRSLPAVPHGAARVRSNGERRSSPTATGGGSPRSTGVPRPHPSIGRTTQA